MIIRTPYTLYGRICANTLFTYTNNTQEELVLEVDLVLYMYLLPGAPLRLQVVLSVQPSRVRNNLYVHVALQNRYIHI